MPNNAPPANWQLPGFDDSLWPNDVVINQIATVGGVVVDRIWPETPQVSATEDTVHRSHFPMPAGITVVSANVEVGVVGTLEEAYINGNSIPGLPYGQPGDHSTLVSFPPAWLVLGGDNVLAARASATGFTISPAFIQFYISCQVA